MPAKFERQLGPGFDIRDFHAQALMTDALPMMIPEQKIDDWIAAKKGAELAYKPDRRSYASFMSSRNASALLEISGFVSRTL